MKCPKCNVTLLMSEKRGIEIDYCPECRGIWLDRGELEKIIEKSESMESSPGNRPYPSSDGYKDHDDDHHEGHYYGHGNKYGKRKGLLSELFD